MPSIVKEYTNARENGLLTNVNNSLKLHKNFDNMSITSATVLLLTDRRRKTKYSHISQALSQHATNATHLLYIDCQKNYSAFL